MSRHSLCAVALAVVVGVCAAVGLENPEEVVVEGVSAIALPKPRIEGAVSLEHALLHRRSVRTFAGGSLTLAEAGQLLWAAQGVTHPEGRRTTPSAGATYPLEVLLVAGTVDGLPAGVYRYIPHGHRLEPVSLGDVRAELTAAALNQRWMRDAPAHIVIAAVNARTAQRYGGRAGRYVAMEVGAAVENIQLQGGALSLGSTFVGAFDDARVKQVVGLRGEEEAMAIVPVGRLRR